MLTLCSSGYGVDGQALSAADVDSVSAESAGLGNKMVHEHVGRVPASPHGPPESRNGIDVTMRPASGRRTMNAGSTARTARVVLARSDTADRVRRPTE